MNKKVVFHSLILLTLFICFYICNRVIEAIRVAMLVGQNLLDAFGGIGGAIASNLWYISTNATDIALAVGVVLAVAMMAGSSRRKNFRPGEEYGSARWGTKKDIAPYIDPVADNNVILTQTESLTMNSRPKKPEFARNKNVVVIGGAGSGKTRFFVKPNIMQCHSSYVVTDPKGTVLTECGKLLEDNGYVIKVFNINGARGMAESLRYNPFDYITCEADILKLVDTLIANTTGEGNQKGEDFWVKAERTFYCALIGYIWEEAEPDERNINTLLNLINASEAREDDETYKCLVDMLFDALANDKPDCFAVRQYRKYKQAAGKTAKSILISCGARLAPFDIAEVRELMTYDELELDKIGDRKTALFVITSDTDKTFNFIAAMMYSQMFNLLCDKALYDYGGRLPVHVRCILDEFANIGKIPNFDEIISVIRSREISASVILQSKAQLEKIYDKAADIIIDNCDTMLFLGGKGIKTLEEISKLLGKETISSTSEGKSRGSQKSDSTNFQGMGRELATIDELAVMERGLCICQVNGVRPFRSSKYNLLKHPRYNLLSDADRRNEYTPPWVTLCSLPKPTEEFIFFDGEEMSDTLELEPALRQIEQGWQPEDSEISATNSETVITTVTLQHPEPLYKQHEHDI